MADKVGDSSGSKKQKEQLDEYPRKQEEALTKYRESLAQRTRRGITTLYTQDTDYDQRLKRKILGFLPIILLRNILKIVLGTLGVLLVIIIFIGGSVFVFQCSTKGTCAYAGTQVNKVLEKTGTQEAAKGTFGRIWDIVWTGGSSKLFNTQTDIRESDVKKYIEIQSPPDKVYFESKPITVATSFIAYNLSEDTPISVLCTLDGYGNDPRISYNYQNPIPGVLGEKKYSVVCTFEDGLKVKSDNADFFDNHRGIMSLVYSSNAKSDWCLYVLSKSALDDYNMRRKDPLEEIKRRDPQCISGNNAGATILEFESAEQLVFGVLDDQPFTQDKDYFWQVKLKEVFDYKGNLNKLDGLYVYVPDPAVLVTEDSSCQFERSSDIEGYNYKLKKDSLEFVNQDCSPIALKKTGISVDECIQTFKEDISFGCPLRIQDISVVRVLPEKVIVKAYANYSYELRESFNVVIKKIPVTPTNG